MSELRKSSFGTTSGGCSSLESIVIPNSVKSIGDEAFWNCLSLKYIEIPNSVTSIGDEAFDGCEILENLSTRSGLTIEELLRSRYRLKMIIQKKSKYWMI